MIPSLDSIFTYYLIIKPPIMLIYIQYSLVNVYITMENHHSELVNPLRMAIFNSYVSLPVGIYPKSCREIGVLHQLSALPRGTTYVEHSCMTHPRFIQRLRLPHPKDLINFMGACRAQMYPRPLLHYFIPATACTQRLDLMSSATCRDWHITEITSWLSPPNAWKNTWLLHQPLRTVMLMISW